jgi:hypothetical protein
VLFWAALGLWGLYTFAVCRQISAFLGISIFKVGPPTRTAPKSG